MIIPHWSITLAGKELAYHACFCKLGAVESLSNFAWSLLDLKRILELLLMLGTIGFFLEKIGNSLSLGWGKELLESVSCSLSESSVVVGRGISAA